MWMFIALLAVYVPFADNNFWAYKTVRQQLLFMPFIISVMMCIRSYDRLKQLITIGIGLMIWISFYAITHNGHGPGNYFTDENDLCLYVNMWLPFCYFLFFHEKRIKARIFYAAGMGVGLLAIVFSFSRGGFIGLISVAACICVISKNKVKGLIILIVLAIGFFLIGDQNYWAEMSTVTNVEDATARARIESWKAGLRMFADNPLGVGGNNFQIRFDEYQGGWFKRGMWGRVAHSLWITLISETGVIGTFIYVMLLYINIADLNRVRKMRQSTPDDPKMAYVKALVPCFFASLAGYFASGTFLSVLYYAHYWYLTGIIVAVHNVAILLVEDTTTRST